MEKTGSTRKRGLTSLALQWIAEKVRRAEELKKQIENKTYKVDSKEVASAILSREN